jgi:glutamate racemase
VNKPKIGVFDSGLGGLSVAKAIEKALPDYEVIFINDAVHVPYGTKDTETIYTYTRPILDQLIEQGCQLIVIACNTVTTNLIERLRQDYTVPLVGIEPMVKPAAENTKSKIIAVCATPRTLSSERYKWLKQTYAKGVKVLEPDCSDWANMIENSALDKEKIAATINNLCEAGADQIVLGCTHYHWIDNIITELASGRAKAIHPENAVVSQVKRVLEQLS